jgi:hypothetical protein
MTAPVQRTQPLAPQQASQPPEAASTGVRWVLRVGLVLGTALLGLAWAHRIRLHLPVQPRIIGTFAGFLVEWVIVAGLATWASHLVKMHHRRVIGYVTSRAQVGALAAGRAAGHHGRRAHAWAQRRWAARGDSWRGPLLLLGWHRQEEPGRYVVVGSARLTSRPDQSHGLPAAAPASGPETEAVK